MLDVSLTKTKETNMCDSVQFFVCYASKVTFSCKSMRDIFNFMLGDIF